MARVRTIFTGVAGTPWYSNLYFANDGSESVSAGAVVAVNAFWTSFAGALSNNVGWDVLGEVAQIDESNGELTGLEVVAAQQGGGSSTDDELPFQTQALIRLNTAAFVHGRRVRGKIFVPALGESNNTGGVPATGLRSALDTAAEALIDSNGGTLVVWSRPFDGTEKNPERVGSKHFVLSSDVSTQWAVLRSRRD